MLQVKLLVSGAKVANSMVASSMNVRAVKSFSSRLVLAACLGLTSWSTAWAAPVPLASATIGDINAAFKDGSLTSEQLVTLYLARIEAYDKQGPKINAVITLNPKALEIAKALDAERKAKGPRSPLHGIPVVLKDNFDTVDLPTTGGSIMLEGSLPPDDAYMVKRLRDAGAIILAKVNLSEFASGGAMSSLGGQTLNPHDLTRTPSGSSGGTGAAIAADYAPLGLGTDTGGSIRGPSTSNGIVGLKPTHGLLNRDGIIPLALSFDTGGPMARSVYDIAVSLGLMTGVDTADAATQKSKGKFHKEYTQFLKKDALKGARIGIARDFLGADEEVDWVIEAALNTMLAQGTTIVDEAFVRSATQAVSDWRFSSTSSASTASIPKESSSKTSPSIASTLPRREVLQFSFKRSGVVTSLSHGDPLTVTIFDAANSQTEERWFTLGLASDGRLLAIAHTYQFIDEHNIRVRLISAREATRRERQAYEHAQL